METRNIIFVVGLLLAAGLLFFVITSSVDGSIYSMDVDEAVTRSSELEGQEIKVAGNVVPGTIMCALGSDECRFKLTRGGETLDVFYDGPKPDEFKDCAEIIATGKLGYQRSFEAVELIAKCPSKYDALPVGCEQENRPEYEKESLDERAPATN